MYNISQKYKSAFIILTKILIIGGAYYLISKKILNNEFMNKSVFFEKLTANIFDNSLVLITIISFTISNWLLEITKWKSLVSSIKYISFYKAFKQSLASLTASLLTPNRIGEYGAKAIYYPKNERYKIMLLNFLGNFSQMTMTVIFGIFGVFFLWEKISLDINISWIQIFGIGLILCIIILMFYNDRLTIYRKQIIHHLKTIPNKIHIKYFLFSFFRYLVFSHQFYFLLVIFGVDIDYSIAMPLIFSMYFISSIIPGFVIFDWLIKGSVAVSIFSIYGINEIIILSITSIMWILNFAIPTIIGSYFVITFNKDPILLKESKIRI